jgi:NTE family protein
VSPQPLRDTNQTYDLVFAGGGSLVVCIVAAYFRLKRAGYKFVRVAGVSAGSLASCVVAFRMTEPEAKKLLLDILGSGKDLLDEGLLNMPLKWGIHGGDTLHRYITQVFPYRLGDAAIPMKLLTYDVEAQRTICFDSEHAPGLEVGDVAMASCSIPWYFRPRRIPGAPGLHIDGGARCNFPMDVMDDVPERPTIGIRFKSGLPSGIHTFQSAKSTLEYPTRHKINGLADFSTRTAAALVDNLNHTHVSNKRYQNVIDIETKGSAIDFTLSPAEVHTRWNDGERAAEAWMRGEKFSL